MILDCWEAGKNPEYYATCRGPVVIPWHIINLLTTRLNRITLQLLLIKSNLHILYIHVFIWLRSVSYSTQISNWMYINHHWHFYVSLKRKLKAENENYMHSSLKILILVMWKTKLDIDNMVDFGIQKEYMLCRCEVPGKSCVWFQASWWLASGVR